MALVARQLSDNAAKTKNRSASCSPTTPPSDVDNAALPDLEPLKGSSSSYSLSSLLFSNDDDASSCCSCSSIRSGSRTPSRCRDSPPSAPVSPISDQSASASSASAASNASGASPTCTLHTFLTDNNEVEGPQRHVLHVDRLKYEGDSHVKVIYFVVVATSFVIAYGDSAWHLDFYQNTAIIMSGIFAQWLIAVLCAISQSKSLCAVRIINTQLEGFGSLISFPTSLIKLENKPIESISEFAGVRGNTIHISTLIMGVCNSLLFIVATQHKKTLIYKEQGLTSLFELNWNQFAVVTLTFVCAIGFLLVGYFEMNHHSWWHTLFHYGAIPLIAIGIVPYGILRNWDTIFWATGGGTGAFLFLCYALCVAIFGNGRKYPNDPRKVHIVSLAHLLLEVGWSSMAATCAVATVYQIDKLGDL